MRLCYVQDQVFFLGPDGRWYAANDFAVDYHLHHLKGLTEWHWWTRRTRTDDTTGLVPVEPTLPTDVKVFFHGPWQRGRSPAGYLWHVPLALGDLSRLVRSCDVVWLRMPFVYSMLAGLLARPDQLVVTQQIGDPSVGLAAIFPAWRLVGALQRSLTRRVHSRADLAVFVSESLRRQFGRGLPNTMVVNESRLTEEVFWNRPAKRSGPLRVAFVGRFSAEKGLDVLFEAAAGLGQVELWMIGRGPLEQPLRESAAKRGFADRVRWLGYKPYGPELFETIRQAHVLVLPSRTEGLPLAIVEAMSQAVPVVGTRVGGIVELVRHSHNGLLIDPGDPRALADALVALMDEPRRLAMAENALTTAREHTLDRQTGRLLTVIGTLKPWRRFTERQPVPAPPRRCRLGLIVTGATSIQLFRGQLRYLARQGFDVTVISSAGWEQQLARDEGATTLTVPMARGINVPADLRSLIRLVGVLSGRRFDIIHVGTPKAALLGSLAAWMTGHRRVVLTVHGRVYENDRGLRRGLLAGLDRIACQLAAVVVPVCRELGQRMVSEHICSAAKVRLVGHGSCSGVDLSIFSRSQSLDRQGAELRRTLAIGPGATVILYMGRLMVEKGLRELAEAFVELAQHRQNIHLLCVGGADARAPLPELTMRLLEDHPRVHLMDWAVYPAPWYAASDIMVLPSYREGFGLTLIEAAAMGLPTIGSDILGIREAMADGVTGLLVPPRDAQALLKAMRTLVADASLRRRLGQAGRDRVERLFDSRTVWSGIVELYRGLLTSVGGEG